VRAHTSDGSGRELVAKLFRALSPNHLGHKPARVFDVTIRIGYGWLEVMCKRCETRASLPLDAIRRPRDTPIWKLEAALKCRSCRTPRYSPPVHMIRLTKERMIAPYVWVHPDDDERR
jgi:hypothetical protein